MTKKISGLRLERVSKGIKQGHVAQQAGIRQSFLCQMESGRIIPNHSERERLASALGVPLRKVNEWFPQDWIYPGRE